MTDSICKHGIVRDGEEAEPEACSCCSVYERSHGARCVECVDGAEQPLMFAPTEHPELYVDRRTQPERVRDGLAALETHELDALRRGARRAS